MDVSDIINAAAEGLDTVHDAWDPETKSPIPNSGDTLAEFVVRELLDVYDPDGSEQSNYANARRAMLLAVGDLERVIEGLIDAAHRVRRQ